MDDETAGTDVAAQTPQAPSETTADTTASGAAEAAAAAAVAQGSPASALSVLDAIRARRDRLADPSRTVVIAVPGLSGLLGVRFKRVPQGVLEGFGIRAEEERGNSAAQVAIMCDLIITACVEIVVKGGEGYRGIDPAGAAPVQFDQRLVEILQLDKRPRPAVPAGVDPVQLPAMTPQEIVLAVHANNDIAVKSTFTRLSQWLANEQAQADEAFVGE